MLHHYNSRWSRRSAESPEVQMEILSPGFDQNWFTRCLFNTTDPLTGPGELDLLTAVFFLKVQTFDSIHIQHRHLDVPRDNGAGLQEESGACWETDMMSALQVLSHQAPHSKIKQWLNQH